MEAKDLGDQDEQRGSMAKRAKDCPNLGANGMAKANQMG
jgi:hypothetical protein